MKMIISENDRRLYRVITLESGLRAMLVSSANDRDVEMRDNEDLGEVTSESGDDAESDYSDSSESSIGCPKEKMAAAALAVRCGSFQEPVHLGGLAHYLEHMLFMGSEKYPIENQYTDFISKHGGSDNAFTETEVTVYFFDVSQPAFGKALDIFANFFVNPLFREDSIEREMEAVESEFQFHQVSDGARLEQVLSEQAGSGHPMGNFFWGNLKSLRDTPKERGISIRDELVKFYNNYYSAECMTLCVQSKHSLDQLEQFVRDSFTSVPRRQRLPIVYPNDQPFSKNPSFYKLFKVVPINRDIMVSFRWVLPSQKHRYKEKALDYLGYAIGHEGQNGILDHLRHKLWALELTAGSEGDGFNENTMCALFTITITLSEEGARNIAEVTKYVHQYMHMLRKKGPQQWLWNELKQIADFDFRFQEEEEARDYVCNMCQAMQEYPEEHYLCGSELYMEYKPEALRKLMDQMMPETCNIMYHNCEFQKNPEQFPLREPWMNVFYSIEDYPEEWKELWADDPEFQKMLNLPEPNRYVPTDFSIKKDETYAFEAFPTVIADRPTLKLWYRKDQNFLVPRCFIDTHLITRLAYAETKTAVCLDAMSDILSQLLAQTNNYAEMASLEYDLNGFNSGMTITFSGFNHKLPLLFDTVMDTLVTFDCSEELFQTIKLNLRKHYYNNVLINTYYGDEVRSAIVNQKYYTMAERREALETLTKQDVVKNARTLCHSAYVEAYVHGNVTSTEALQLVAGLESKLAANPPDRMVEQLHAIISGETYVRLLSINPEDKNSRIINYYSYGPAHFYEETMMQFLVTLMEERCFQILRTEQQLGYDTRCSMNNYRGVIGFSVSISPLATKFTLSHVDEKIDEFVDDMVEMVKKLSADEFTAVRDALIKIKLCVDLSMEDEQKRNWNQIVQFQYVFDRNQLEAQFLKILELERFRDWCLRVLPSENRDRKKLSVQVVGYGKQALEECEGGAKIWKEFEEKGDNKGQEEDDPDIPAMRMLKPVNPGKKKFIDDVKAYLSTLEYYPVVKRNPKEPFDF
ncbi:nardilysin-like [Tropilaelaps mercedesae]|uniref:Nardilysin-like n=1 Tax=Tropilaelaps mercedesae TaxID=418985 RepID=A0A1V9XMY5_9ACAR|nr:nardilysin-like [Tropilaelaps mercedesae]